MTITQKELADRVRQARIACGMKQEDVAENLEVSRPTYTQIENGNRAISSLELTRLAYLFGRDLREFVADSSSNDDPLAVLFRAHPDVGESEGIADALRDCAALARELSNLEQLLGISRDAQAPPAYAHPAPTSRREAVQQGLRTAEDERRRLGLGDKPAPDICELLEVQGIRTGKAKLPEEISGLTLYDKTVGFFVVANENHHWLRRRFSYAHEYGHVLLDRQRCGSVSVVSARNDLLEVRANVLAAAFLMPESGVAEFIASLGKGKASRTYTTVFDEEGSVPVEGRTEPGSQDLQLYDVVQLAHNFSVSRQAALYRLKNLGFLKEPELERLKAEDLDKGNQVSTLLGFNEVSHEHARNEFRHRFVSLALEAYRRDKISRKKLLELGGMVDVGGEDLTALLQSLGLDTPEDREADVLLPGEGA